MCKSVQAGLSKGAAEEADAIHDTPTAAPAPATE